MSDKQFAEGFFVEHKTINGQNGSFQITKIGVNVEKAIAFLKKNANAQGYVNLDLKTSQNGKAYIELNTWRGRDQAQQALAPDYTQDDPYSDDIKLEDVPF